MRRHEVKECQKTISEYLSKSGFTDAPNGNTPSPLSPTNSVGSQVDINHLLIIRYFELIKTNIRILNIAVVRIFFASEQPSFVRNLHEYQ